MSVLCSEILKLRIEHSVEGILVLMGELSSSLLGVDHDSVGMVGVTSIFVEMDLEVTGDLLILEEVEVNVLSFWLAVRSKCFKEGESMSSVTSSTTVLDGENEVGVVGGLKNLRRVLSSLHI